MTYRSVDFDTVAPLMPFDKTASQVAGKGEHFEWQPPHDLCHSETPILTRRPTAKEKGKPGFVDLTGIKAGRLTVMGLAGFSSHEKTRWVVRCQCGDYEIRRAKTIKKWASSEETSGVMCWECGYTRKLQRGCHNPKKAAAAERAIMEAAR